MGAGVAGERRPDVVTSAYWIAPIGHGPARDYQAELHNLQVKDRE